MAEAAAREDAPQSIHALQMEEQRSIADRSRLDAESRVDVFKWELMKAQASVQACQSSLEDERAACRELTARLADTEMRVHDCERAPAGNASLRRRPCPGDCDTASQANAAFAGQGRAKIRMRETFNNQACADNNEMA